MPAHKTGFLVPFRAGPSPGKGLGVFATAPIAQGKRTAPEFLGDRR